MLHLRYSFRGYPYWERLNFRSPERFDAQSRPPSGNPPEPSKREPSVNLLIGSHLRIFQCDAISDNGNSVSTADLLDIPLYDNIAVFLIKLYGEANSVGLLACDKRRTTATEGSSTIQLVRLLFIIGYASSAIASWWGGRHSSLVFQIPRWCLLAVGIPVVLAFLLPAEQDGSCCH